MNLSTLTGDAKPYLEYGWVCAPNTAGQSITANTLTTLTIDTEVADTGGFGSVASNQITLASGTYLFKARVPYHPSNATYSGASEAILSLYNVSDSSYITRTVNRWMYPSYGNELVDIEGQFTISSSKTFAIRLANNETGYVGAAGYPAITLSGSSDCQRTTIKLWKLA